jgi:hypothetical protein
MKRIIPDNRFADPACTVACLQTNYYKIANPTRPWRHHFLLKKDGNAIHSAVYLADDIVFTKNGNNLARPWMMMRLKDLLDQYTTGKVLSVIVYRNKYW